MSDVQFRSPAPWRHQFDNARDPYTARNALGIPEGGGGGGGGAPADAEYVTAAADATLTNERVLTDSATIAWDLTTPGQVKANSTAGGGNVSNVGTPAADDFAVWTTATTIKGITPAAALTAIGAQPAGSYGNVSNAGTPTAGQYAKWTAATTIQGVAPATVLADIGAQPAGSYLTTVAAAATYQPLDADLTALAALTGTNTIYYRSGADTWSPVTFSGLTFSGGVLTATASGITQADADLRYVNIPGDTMTGPLVMPSTGTAGATSINFGSALTGIYGTGSQVCFSTANVERVKLINTDLQLTVRLQAPAGSALAAAVHFGTSNTGFYGGAAPDIRATVGGANKLILSGTALTMTVPVVLPADPTANLEAATKQYVDNKSFQPLDADLTAIAALTGTNTIYYRSAANTWSAVNVSTGLAFSGGNLTATGGGGNVSNVGTPTSGQLARWTTALTIEGVAAGAVLPAPQHGRLTYVSATQIKFAPYGGDQIKINGTLYTIPAAGITAANTGIFLGGVGGNNLNSNTTYLVCVFDNSGTLTMNFSASLGHVADTTAGNVGVEILSGFSTMTVIGMVRTNASAQFQDDAVFRGVISWFNRRALALCGTNTAISTASGSLVELTTAARVQFVTWSEEHIISYLQGSYYLAAAGTGAGNIGYDGSAVLVSAQNATQGTASWWMGISGDRAFPATEGYHYLTPMGHSGGVGGSFHLSVGAIIRG